MSSSAAVGAKTARACDYCIRRRARWYCAADDAFLCEACDGSVHSANALAGRHERVRLNTASLKPCIPSWHRGVHTRPRTPRHGKKHHHHSSKVVLHPSSAHVPELGLSATTTTTTTTTTSRDEDTDHLQCLYRVPVLDPFVSELCSSSAGESKYTELVLLDRQDKECNNNNNNSHHESGFHLNLDMNLDMDMVEFAADVESLLGKGLDGEGYMMDELVKAEEEEETMPFELSFDYNSPRSTEPRSAKYDEKREWRMSLRLDYEAIRAAWARNGSPWMNGERPQINPNDCWLHNSTMGGVGTVRAIGGHGASGDGGREARVTRYREKRRTRLFSKKIRYEVRKLNAEKRPRMKGRFVKRSSFSPTTPIATL